MNKLSKDFLIDTFLIMILSWGVFLMCYLAGIHIEDHFWLYLPYLLGGWSPTIASYLTLKKNGKIDGLKEWIKNIFDFKHGILSYLLVVVLGSSYILIQCLISGYDMRNPVYMLIIMIPIMMCIGGLEEAGWRYILQPELEKKYPYFLATIIVGVIWWLWHFPLFYVNNDAQFGLNYIAFGINVLGLSFALACIRKTTKSVWLCVLFHSIVNSLTAIFSVRDNIWGNIGATMFMIVSTLIIVKVLRGRLKPQNLEEY